MSYSIHIRRVNDGGESFDDRNVSPISLSEWKKAIENTPGVQLASGDAVVTNPHTERLLISQIQVATPKFIIRRSQNGFAFTHGLTVPSPSKDCQASKSLLILYAEPHVCSLAPSLPEL
jgi:hypothetical protein